jgi:NAD-dependent SIR2 family protein deacetylase
VGGLWLNFVRICYPNWSFFKRQQDETKLAKPEAFKEDPSQVWQFYHPRRQM